MKDRIVEKVIFIICGLLVLALAGSIDYDEELARDEHYCFMVEMFKQSNGESGWPDFNGNYDEVCD
jgi:hypothetical protein